MDIKNREFFKMGFFWFFFGGFWGNGGFLVAKTHSGHCGTIENRQKSGLKLTKS